MNKAERKSLLNKLRVVIAATVMATAGLAMVSAPANAGATSTPILITYDAGGTSSSGYVNISSSGGADAGSITDIVANANSHGGSGNVGSVAKSSGGDEWRKYGGAILWANTTTGCGTGWAQGTGCFPFGQHQDAGSGWNVVDDLASTNPRVTDFSLMPTGPGTNGTTVSIKVYASGANQVGKTVSMRMAWGFIGAGNVIESTSATLLSGWNTYNLVFAADAVAGHRYWQAFLHFDGYNGSAGGADNTETFLFDDVSFPNAGTQSPSTCTSANPCESRIDWAGSTGVLKGYHNLEAESDISIENDYYADGVGYYQAYVKAGSTFTLRFLVKDENGAIRPNLGVALRANKGYSNSTAHWLINGTAVSPAGTADGGLFSANTDSNGYVSFTVTNTDTNPQAIPASFAQDDKDTTSFGAFALLQDSSDTAEALDIIEIHAYGLGLKMGATNGYETQDGVVLTVPVLNYNSSFTYSASATKGDAGIAGGQILVRNLKDGDSTKVTVNISNGIDSSAVTFNASYITPIAVKSGAYITYDAVKKTVTCNNATYNKTPTDTAYYLYLNRVLKGGKKFGTTTGLQYMHRAVNLSLEGVTATSATWNVPASWNTNNIARVYCETQAFAGPYDARSMSSGYTIPRTGKYVVRSSTPVKLNPSAVTMRLVEPTLTKDAAGKAVNYYDWTWNALEYNWAQYYGKNLAFIYKYINVGSTTTLKWKVTDTDSGSVLDNFPVSLIINKNYGGMQNATFSYLVSGEKKVATASPANNGTGETVIAGMTDDEGYVTFVITNTNTAAQAEAKPAALNAMQPAGGTDLHAQITLTAGLAQTKESIDLLEFHIVKP